MSQATQDKRIAEFDTPLGKDTLVLTRFDATEGLGSLFEFRIEALSEKKDIDFDGAIGKACSITYRSYQSERIFNGILVEALWLGVRGDFYAYQLVLRPWLWMLSRTSDCRIFSEKKAPDIIKQVFSDRGFSDFRESLTESYPTLEYCVQYRETDLAFVSRLMEQHGIYYFFEHTRDKHTLVLADSRSSHSPIPGVSSLRFIPDRDSDREDREHLFEWVEDRRFRTGKIELNDYDYMKPNAKLISDAKGSEHYTRSEMEIYDYPGKYLERGDGDKYAKVRLEAEQALDHRRHGSGDAVSMLPGGLVNLEKHPKSAENAEYLVIQSAHSFISEFYRSAAERTGESIYHGTYQFLKSDRVFRAPLTTPKAMVYGPQTARVVGKDGEEIDVDDLGRIKVEFFWDRKKVQSCRIRVGQVWSYKGWGGQIIPRIGQEVIVEFLEGDPDRPLVVGTVYNKDTPLPYDLPGNKTQSGLKSNSSKGGGGFNEWRFEDKKDSEQIFIHAQKDLDIVVLNRETRQVGEKFQTAKGESSRIAQLKNGDDELSVDKGNQKVKIATDQTIDVGENIKITAGTSIELKVGPSTIKMDNSGITIKAPNITVDGTITEVKGAATLTLQGGLVKIN